MHRGIDSTRRALRRLPIRWRLTITFAAVMAVLLAALISFVWLHLRSDLDHNINQSLRSRALDIAGLVREQDASLTRGDLHRLPPSPDNVVQILGLDGRVLATTGAAGQPALLRPSELAAAIRRPQTITRGEALRLYSTPLRAEGTIFVAGVSLAERDAALDKLETELAIASPAALLLATLAAYALAAAALRPVERMRRRAALISSDALGQRLPLSAPDDEVRRLGTTLNDMLARLEDGLRRERLFVASASHELRMPLAILRAELEVALREDAGVDGLRAAIGSAIEETDRMAQLAQDLLLLARAEDGTLPVAIEPVAVHTLLDELLARFAPVAAEHRRPLSVDACALHEGAVALADPARVLQAVSNLVDNTLRYGAGAIVLRAESSDRAVTIHVYDEGPGFDEALLPRAFDRFSRADPARGRGGTGLGLAVVETIAQAHGGRAGARNLTGGGADVWIELPAAGQEALIPVS